MKVAYLEASRTMDSILKWLAFFSCLLLFYASILPLEYRPIRPEEALDRWRSIPWLILDLDSRADWIANGIVVVPVAFFVCGATGFKVTSRFFEFLCALAGVVIVCLFVFAIEFVQIWFPRRTLSMNDIFAGCLGAMVGGVGWFFFGKRLVREFELAFRSPIKSERVSRIALFLSFFAVFHMLFPFDFVTSFEELSKKHSTGGLKIYFVRTLIGFPFDWIDSFRNLLRYTPIGIWYSYTRRTRPSVFFCFLFPCCIEVMQFFILSRSASVTDSIAGGFGILIGSRINFDNWSRSINAMSNLSVLVFLLTYIAFLILATLGKAEMLIADPDQIRIRIEQFFSIPLSRYYLKTEFTAFNLLFSKLIVFVPIGFLLGKIINGSKWADRIWFVLLSCGALGVMLEFLQVFAPPLIPDVWDAVFYALGGVVGFHFLQTILMSSNTGQGVGKS